jgi:hypothetical protein
LLILSITYCNARALKRQSRHPSFLLLCPESGIGLFDLYYRFQL